MTKKDIDNILYGIGCNSYNRFEHFLNIRKDLHGRLYWYALGNAYQSSDNLYRMKGMVISSFNRPEPDRHFLMTAKERNYLEGLPDKIHIYRGMTLAEKRSKYFGVSWTLEKRIAEFFAYEYGRNHSTKNMAKTVQEITINKSEVIAFFNGRKEFEIIYIAP